MPTFMTERIARALYRSGNPPLTYSREWFANHWPFVDRVETLVELGIFGRALVVGSGFGFLIEELLERGVDAYGVEPGEWFWDPKNKEDWDPEAKERTFRDWVGSGTDFDDYDWIVDEDAITMHDDDELPRFIQELENISGRIVHIVTPGTVGDSAVNWKTEGDWKLIAPTHTWISIRTLQEF